MGRFSKLEWEPEKKKTTESGLRNVKDREKLSEPPVSEVEEDIYDYHHYILKAEEFYFKGDYKNSLRHYSRALQEDNSQITPWVGQVLCLISINQLKEADLWISRALELFPENPQIISLRALIYANKGMVKRAIATSDYALSIKAGGTPLVWIARGEILLVAYNKNSSMCFEKAIELTNKNDWQTPTLIGDVFFRHKQFPNASHYYQIACEKNMTHYYLWYSLGSAYAKLDFQQKAIDAFQRSIDLNTEFKPAQEGLYNVTHASVIDRILKYPANLLSAIFSKKPKNIE